MCFISKKNQVTLEDNMIKKTFFKEQDFYTELFFYQEFKEFTYLPKLIKFNDFSLFLEYLPGKNLYDISMENQLLLAKTLAEFHNFSANDKDFGITHFDTNLRNYIFYENKIYIIDFSEISVDYHLNDVYSALLFFSEIYDENTFAVFFDKFFEIYANNRNININHSVDIMDNAMKRFIDRRERIYPFRPS